MPVKSKDQLKFMYGVASGDIKGGPSKKVAEEMIAKTPSSKKRKLINESKILK